MSILTPRINDLEINKQPLLGLAYLYYELPSGSNPVTPATGSYNTVTLNTQVGGVGFCTLSSNIFTLAAGTYDIQATNMTEDTNRSPANSRCRSRILNVTDNVAVITGLTSFIDPSDAPSSGSAVPVIASGMFTIASSKDFSFQIFASSGATLGVPRTDGSPETYAIIRIMKVG